MTGTASRSVIVGLLAGAVLSAQTPTPSPQQRPVFRSGTTVVPLTVTVLDGKGVPITDLKQSDFTVYENKSQREILNFFPQAFAPGPPGTAASDGIAPQTSRLFLFVLGPCDNMFKGLDRATAFVRDRLLPQDAIALMGFHRTTPFTADHELVARTLERYKATCASIAKDTWLLQLSQVRSLFGKPPDDDAIRANRSRILARMDAVFGGIAPLRNTTDLLFGMDGVVPVVDKPWQRQDTFADIVDSLGGGDLVVSSNRLKLIAGVEYLRYLDGERHLVFLSAGGLARDADDAKIVARRAADARVVVDMIGTEQFSWASKDVVELTGGYYTSLDYADKALARIDRSSRFSYLLGYAPSNATLDGKYREVEVKVNRPGAEVRFGHGYYARAQPDPIDVKELIFKSRLQAVLAYASDARDITLGVSAYVVPRMGIGLEARVQITIDASQLTFETKDGFRTDQLELQVYCGDAREVVMGDFGERLELQATEETHAEWLKTGIQRRVRVPVATAPRFVKVIVYDYGSDRVGSFILTIK